jgi:hypothetical protein
VRAAREFITVITRHAEQYDAPGYERERHLAITTVVIAATELHLALEGRTIFDPPTRRDDAAPRVFGEIELHVTPQLGIIAECLRHLLRRIGYVGEQTEGASYGTLPSIKGLENLPQVGLPELPHLIKATDALDALINRCPTSGARADDQKVVPQQNNQRRGRRRGQDKIGEAITRLTARMKDDLPVDIPSIAKDVGCSPENLRQSKRFIDAYRTLQRAFIRVPRGRKKDGIVEADDDGND